MIRRLLRWARTAVVLVVALVAVPDAAVRPATVSLVAVESASAVDLGRDRVWVLALGSDARSGPIGEGLTDVIELIGFDPRTGRAVAIGIPRDAYVMLPKGPGRINDAYRQGQAQLATDTVADLTGISPDFVLLTGFDGFTSMMDEIGDVVVQSPTAYTLEDVGLEVQRGRNVFTPAQSLDFVRSRNLTGDDFARVENHQRFLRAVLEEVRRERGVVGYLEGLTSVVVGGLETDLSPAQLYRFVQAVTLVDPARAQGCVLRGTSVERGGASVVILDPEQPRALGGDAADDLRLQGGCH